MSASPAIHTPPRPRLLLVDDDLTVTRSVSRLLERHGWDVRTTNRAFGVLNLLAEQRPRVLVVDVRMPGLEGSQIAELVRADPDLAETRIVLHSGIHPAELEIAARSARADAWVSKEAHPAELVETLRELR